MKSYSLLNIDLSKIGSNDLYNVLNLIISNKNINFGATEICFELFQRKFSTYFESKILNPDDATINQLSVYLPKLICENKFSKELFCEILFSKLKHNLPLKLIAWLDENNIFHFTQYCIMHSTSNISAELTDLIENYTNQEISYIFLKLIMAAYSIGITNTSILFSMKCRKILDNFLNSNLIKFEDENPELINIFPIIGELDFLLYGEVIKLFTKQILLNLLTHKEIVTVQDAFMLQELWSLKNISDQLLIIYYELVKYYSFEEIFELINNIPIKKLNWKYALILISVYVKKYTEAHVQLKDLINRKLKLVFSDHMKTLDLTDLKPSTELLNCIIFVRQLCYERDNPQLVYSEWYSNTFGLNTSLRTGSDPIAFNLLLTTLSSVVNKEPIHFLRIHIERSIRTPSGCHGDMLVFKDICRVQLSRIVQSEQINIKTLCFPIITLLEEALNRFDCIWALRQTNICKLILPYIINDTKYDRLKEMILLNGSVNETDILESKKLSIMNKKIYNVECNIEEIIIE